MAPDGVIEPLDIVEHICLGLVPGDRFCVLCARSSLCEQTIVLFDATSLVHASHQPTGDHADHKFVYATIRQCYSGSRVHSIPSYSRLPSLNRLSRGHVQSGRRRARYAAADRHSEDVFDLGRRPLDRGRITNSRSSAARMSHSVPSWVPEAPFSTVEMVA